LETDSPHLSDVGLSGTLAGILINIKELLRKLRSCTKPQMPRTEDNHVKTKEIHTAALGISMWKKDGGGSESSYFTFSKGARR